MPSEKIKTHNSVIQMERQRKCIGWTSKRL